MLLFPEDPKEAFDFAALSFDLADRLQTPIFVMLDLDIGMQDWLCEPLSWNDKRSHDRGKVMTYEMLEAGKDFGRYLDVDSDGIPYRTHPGTHPKRGSYFTRGTTKDRYARYSEDGATYVDNMQRLLRKFETAKQYVPAPVVRSAGQATRFGAIYYGSTGPAMDETLATAAVDLCGRPFCVWKADVPLETLGAFSSTLAEEFWRAVSSSGVFALHVDVHHGRNTHHIIEAIFKATARALREAVELDPRSPGVPSTKGVL